MNILIFPNRRLDDTTATSKFYSTAWFLDNPFLLPQRRYFILCKDPFRKYLFYSLVHFFFFLNKKDIKNQHEKNEKNLRNNDITLLAKCWNCTEHRRKSIRVEYRIRSSKKISYPRLTIKVNICMK